MWFSSTIMKRMARSLETLPVANVALTPLGDEIADYRMLAALPCAAGHLCWERRNEKRLSKRL
jgi:hypothetical protein